MFDFTSVVERKTGRLHRSNERLPAMTPLPLVVVDVSSYMQLRIDYVTYLLMSAGQYGSHVRKRKGIEPLGSPLQAQRSFVVENHVRRGMFLVLRSCYKTLSDCVHVRLVAVATQRLCFAFAVGAETEPPLTHSCISQHV